MQNIVGKAEIMRISDLYLFSMCDTNNYCANCDWIHPGNFSWTLPAIICRIDCLVNSYEIFLSLPFSYRSYPSVLQCFVLKFDRQELVL